MPSRRYHTKTRTGCMPCKRAHVKCDQIRPTCSKCSKAGRRCEYGSGPAKAPKSSNDSKYTTRASTIPRSEPNNTTGEPTSSSDFEPFDLQLMHQFTAATYLTISEPDDHLQAAAWQTAVPKEASKQPFLMHSLLALAALHKLSLGEAGDKDICLDAAIKHHNLSLSKSKDALENFNKDNLNAMFVFSATIVILALALPIYSKSHGLSDPPAELAQIIALIRGSVTIIKTDPHLVRGSDLAPLLRDGFLTSTADLPADSKFQLDSVKLKIMSSGFDQNVQGVYLKAVALLDLCYRNMVPSPEDGGVVLCWLAMIPQELTSLIIDKELMAFALLAHYAVLLHALKDVWWCKGWGVELFQFIWNALEGEGEWQQLIEWPKQKIDRPYPFGPPKRTPV